MARIFGLVLVTALAACDGGDSGSPVADACTLLCDRTVLCTESYVAPMVKAGDGGNPDDWTCEFNDQDGARATCQSGCEAAGESPVTAECIACLADNMSCTTTASMRECDVDCQPTMFVTGEDFEGAAEYDYSSWFFEGVSELDGITCLAAD